jgi:putative ABC transport system permease protein
MNLFSLIWSNLFRRKVRTFLTLFSVLVAFLLFTLLRTITGAFSGEVNIAGVDRLTVLSKYSMIELLPMSHMNEIRQIEGVDSVVHQTFFGGSYQAINNFFFKFPVNPREYFAMYPEYEISPEQLDTFERTRNGAVVPADMAERYGWQIGDNIPIEGDIWILESEEPWIFQLVGTYSRPDGEAAAANDPFMMHFDYFNEGRPEVTRGAVGWFTVKVSNPDNAAQVAAQIDAAFENSSSPTRTATEAESNRQFVEQLGDIGLMMNGILSAVFFTILLLTANTMTQSFRERVPELAVLKTFGFSDMTVSLLVLAESIALCVIGGAMGIGVAALISDSIRPQVESFISPFQLTADTLILGFAIAVLLGLVVGLVPAITAKRLQIVDALRE